MTNTVTFKVDGAEVSSFIDQIKRKADDLTNKMIENAKEQAEKAKDQLKIIEDEIKAIQRKADIEVRAAKEVAAAKKDEAVKRIETEYSSTVEGLYSNKDMHPKLKEKKFERADEDYKAKMSIADAAYKDELKSIKEQERNSTIQTKLLRDNIETIKSTSNQEVQQIKKGDELLIKEIDEGSSPIDKFTRDLTEDRLDDGKGGSGKGGKGSGKEAGIVGSILSVDNLNKFVGNIGKLAQTQNGFDLIAPASQGIGQIVGTIVGGALGAVVSGGAGTLLGASMGGSIGGMIGGTGGDFLQRRAMAAQEFTGARNKYEATSQQGISGIPDTVSMGLSAGEFLTVLREIAVSSGTTADATGRTMDVLEMEKGLGIGKEVSESFLHIFRGTNKDLSQLVGGVMARGNGSIFQGGDATYLNEFLGKMSGMINTLRQTTETVHTGTAMDIMKRFDKVGGAFSSRDDRSTGLINQINSSLINPGSDSMKAYSFLALRQQNPNMGIADLKMEQEKGLGSPAYLKAMLSQVDQLGGDDQMKRMNIAGMLGINQSAAKRLYENRGALTSGKISQEDLEDIEHGAGGYGAGGYGAQAAAKTTDMEKNTAAIKNGLLDGWINGVDAMVTAFQNAMQSAFNGATIHMENGSIKFGGPVIQNATKTLEKKSTFSSNNVGDNPFAKSMGGNIYPSEFR